MAVEGSLYHFDREYSYSVPPDMAQTLCPGCRVRVGFGRGDLRRLAIVLAVETPEDTSALKPILEQLDPAPLLDEEGLMLLRHVREHTFCTWFDALRLLLPAGLGIVFKTLYAAAKTAVDLPLTVRQRELVDYVKSRKAPVGEERLTIGFDLRPGELEELVRLGALEQLEQSRRQLLDDKITMVRLLDGWENEKLTPKQKLAAAFLAENESASLKELCYYTGVTRAVAEALCQKGVAGFYDHIVPRNPYAEAEREKKTEAVILNGPQTAALDTLGGLLQKPDKPALLYGVTGSGKTQVYLALIDKVLGQGRGVIVLVPEISLTAQTLESFHRRFGGRVAVLHSGLSLGERMDEWRRLRDGKADIAVGTRSAVFAPVRNLGLLVIDEEQEHTYQSDRSPRYHARDIARVRCRHHGALLLLSSATPAIESYHAAKTERYHLVTLAGRYGGQTLPAVDIVDMGDASNHTDTPSLSLPLREELLANLERGEQSILLLNRRGHSTLLRCSACGEVANCPACSLALTYHAANGHMLCHYCGYQASRAPACSVCGSTLTRLSGVGTQRLEEELCAVFPAARVLRVDMDTTMRKHSHRQHFAAFAAGEYDIMLGTQMVAKGLNFPNVTLVGVLAADQSLYSNDYRSFERSFALLTQVVGRGGRGGRRGRAMIQTYSPEHPVIELAARQDYPAFYREEAHSRKLHLYPPFCAMMGITFAGADQVKALEGARAFLGCLRALAKEKYPTLPLRVLGPAPADLFKAAGKYRYRLLLKCRAGPDTRALLREALVWFYGEGGKVSIHIEPYL